MAEGTRRSVRGKDDSCAPHRSWFDGMFGCLVPTLIVVGLCVAAIALAFVWYGKEMGRQLVP